MPDDVPDYEQAFFVRFRMPLEEGIEFLRRRAALLHRRTARTTCGADDALELVHDLLVDKILPALVREPDRPIGNPKGYLSTLLRNFHIDFLRRKGLRLIPMDDLDDSAGGEEPDSAALRAWFWGVVDGPQFPPDCAEVIRMRLDRETCDEVRLWEEIGDELGITRDTARRRFSKGVDIIRQMLDGEGEEET